MALKLKSPVTIAVSVVVIGLVVLLATIVPQKLRERQRVQVHRKAHVALARQDYEAAEKHFKELLEFLPDSAGVMLYLSRALVAQDKFDEALEWSNKAAEIAPDQPQPLGQKAVVLRSKAKHKLETPDADEKTLDAVVALCAQSKELLERAGQLAGADPTIQAETGQLYVVRADEARARARGLQKASEELRQRGQLDEAVKVQAEADPWRIKEQEWLNKAVEELTGAVKLAPKQMAITEMLARACWRAERWADIVVAFRTATTTGKPTARTAILAARAQLQAAAKVGAASVDQARRLAHEMLSQSIEAHPYNIELVLELAEIDLKRGDLEGAAELLETAGVLDESSVKLQRLRARVHVQRGEQDKARTTLEGLLADHPKNVDVLLDLAEVVGLEGQADRSLALLEQAVRTDVFHAEARRRLARALFGRGLWSQAFDVLAEGLRWDPTSYHLLTATTQAIVRYGRDEKRIDSLLDRARKLGKIQQGLTGDLVLLALRLDKPGWAKRVLAEDKKLNPKLPVAAVVLAGVALQDGKPQQALKRLQPIVGRLEQLPKAELYVGEASAQMGKLHSADVEIEKALLACENDYLMTLQAVEVYLRAGMLAEAQRRSRRLLDEDPEAPASLLRAIRLALLSGETGQATRLAARLQALGVKPVRPLDAAAMSLLSGQAAAALDRAKGLSDPVATMVRYHALRSTGKSDEAAKELVRGMEAHPAMTPLVLRYAEHMAHAGKVSEGAARLTQLSGKSPAGSALGLGRLYTLTNADDRALKAYRDAIAAKPGKVNKYHETLLHLALADAYQTLGRTEDQLKVYQHMQQDSAMGVKGLEAAVYLSIRLGQQKQVTGLLDKLAQPVGNQEMSPDLLDRLAGAYVQADQPSKALEIYDRIASQVPDARWVWRDRVRAHLRAGQVGDARSTLREALGHWPGNRGLLLDLAALRIRSGSYGEAYQVLSGIITEQTGPLARQDRGLMLESLGLCEAAAEDLSVSAAPKGSADFQAMLALARCHERAGRLKKAIALLERIPSTAEGYAEARSLLADIRVRQGRPDAAIKALQEAVRNAWSNQAAWSLFGEYLRQGRIDDAKAFAVSRASSAVMPERVNWALTSGTIAPVKSVLDRQADNVGLAVRQAGWHLANGNAKQALSVLNIKSSSGAKPVAAPGPIAGILTTVAEAKSGDVARARELLGKLGKSKERLDSLRVAVALARLAVEDKPSTDDVSKALAASDELGFVLAAAKRAASPKGREAAGTLAAAFVAERLRSPLMCYQLAERAIQADADNPAAHAMRLRVLRSLNAADSATYKKLAADFIQRFGKTALGRHVAVLVALDQSKIDEAAKLIADWKSPTADALVAIARKADQAGRKQDALRWFEQALKCDPQRVPALCGTARLLIDLKGNEAAALNRALKLAEQAMSLSDGSAEASAALGCVLVRRAKIDQALPLLQRAVTAMPSDPVVQYYLGRAYLASNEVVMARLHLEHVAESAKDKDLADAARQFLDKLPKPTTTKKAAYPVGNAAREMT